MAGKINIDKTVLIGGKLHYKSQLDKQHDPVLKEARRLTGVHFRKRGTRLGPVTEALYHAGGEELIAWIGAATPTGAVVADTIASIVLDAMHAEQDAEAERIEAELLKKIRD